jgi:adenylyl-sulfate kinase
MLSKSVNLMGIRAIWYGAASRRPPPTGCLPKSQVRFCRFNSPVGQRVTQPTAERVPIARQCRSIQVSEGFTLWFTGLSGAGKSTISTMVAQQLRERGLRVELLDGDVVRTNLSKGLGFSKEDRDENVRRIGFICEMLSRHGVAAIAAAISPYRSIRDEVRSKTKKFVEVYVECPLDTLVQRDVKGLYKRALAGEIDNFTGVSDPYEPPLNPEVVVKTSQESPEQSVAAIMAKLEALGYLGSPNRRHTVRAGA